MVSCRQIMSDQQRDLEAKASVRRYVARSKQVGLRSQTFGVTCLAIGVLVGAITTQGLIVLDGYGSHERAQSKQCQTTLSQTFAIECWCSLCHM